MATSQPSQGELVEASTRFEAVAKKWSAKEKSAKQVRPEGIVDLRSDTVTTPTTAMRAAMACACVGDDVFGDDPTIWEIEERIATLMGKEAAIFVPTGTMGNLVSVMAHTYDARDAEVIVGHHSHMCIYEQGGIATVAHVHPRQLQNQPDGSIKLEDIEEAIRPVDDHFPTTKLVCVENTHNKKGGLVLSLEYLDALGELLKSKNVKLHVDGARVFAAAAALDVPPSRVVSMADSVSVCMSKALGAPAGSVVVGDAAFIRRCRRARKVLGGGMRQAGVLAAAALVALDETLPRLKEDQRRAHAFASAIANDTGSLRSALDVDLNAVHTNLVYVSVRPDNPAGLKAPAIIQTMRSHKVWALPISDYQMRFVFHHQVDDNAVDAAIAALRASV